jgi:diaminopimelate epimerase
LSTLQFTKMHGLGNDFVVIDAVRQKVNLTAEYVRALADRRRGIGFDQLLLVQAATGSDHDFLYRIFNADGSEVAQCGNGARCLALFIRDARLSDKAWVTLKARSGLLRVHLDSENTATVELASPIWQPAKIPFLADCQATIYKINVAGGNIEGGVVSVGNPHFIHQVPDLDAATFVQLAHELSVHARFPEGANVSFIQVHDRKTIKMRVYERGVGQTQACGSAAFAAAAVAKLWGCVDSAVHVIQPGGQLTVSCSKNEQLWRVSGAVARVYAADLVK